MTLQLELNYAYLTPLKAIVKHYPGGQVYCWKILENLKKIYQLLATQLF
jgi:hypothetical protein